MSKKFEKTRDLPEMQSEWLWAEDLQGKDVTLTISRVGVETLQNVDGKEDKTVLDFAEMDKRPKENRKRLGLNKTNIKTIEKLHGKHLDGWIGKQITLYPTRAQAFGEMVDCIRVRPQVKARPV